MSLKIAILDDYQNVALELADWSPLGAGIEVFHDTTTDHTGLVQRLMPFDVVCLMRERTPMTAALIEALPQLKMLVTSGPRNASIDLAAAKARGIPVCGTTSRATPTAELAMTIILALQRRLIANTDSLRHGGWQAGLGRDVHGLTLGIIGLGRLGGQLARLGQAFGMHTVAWSQNLTDARCAELGVRRMPDLHSLLAESDAASIHLVLSDRSRGLIDRAALGAIKKGGYLINTSRGPIVEKAALIAALDSGRLAGAGLDVFDTEPLPPDDPLRRRDLIDSGRLLLTPHLGYATRQTFETFYKETVEDILAWQQGKPIRLL